MVVRVNRINGIDFMTNAGPNNYDTMSVSNIHIIGYISYM